MDKACKLAADSANHARYVAGQEKGHYESYFMRANHPTKPQAFWIRYTVFTPKNDPSRALGELWAVFFDGKTKQHVAVKDEFSIGDCTFSNDSFLVQIGNSKLNEEKLRGKASAGNNTIEWNLGYTCDQDPLFLLPLGLYKGGFPKAKALVGNPLANFKGILIINGKEMEIKDWVGSQNHNWGSKHTDLYAWGQVAGFDNAPESFLEIGTARLKFGPVWTPKITVMVLRHEGKEYALNSIWRGLRAYGHFEYFTWDFKSAADGVTIQGTMRADASDFVGLHYYNPPGGVKHCLNSKIAQCTVTLIDESQAGTPKTVVLSTKNRAAFEILTDDRDHGIELRV